MGLLLIEMLVSISTELSQLLQRYLGGHSTSLVWHLTPKSVGVLHHTLVLCMTYTGCGRCSKEHECPTNCSNDVISPTAVYNALVDGCGEYLGFI